MTRGTGGCQERKEVKAGFSLLDNVEGESMFPGRSNRDMGTGRPWLVSQAMASC